jgi:hypothetical protein
MSTWNLLGGKRLTTSPPSVSQLSRENVGASTSHNPMGLHGLLQGQLYFLLGDGPGCISLFGKLSEFLLKKASRVECLLLRFSSRSIFFRSRILCQTPLFTSMFHSKFGLFSVSDIIHFIQETADKYRVKFWCTR